MSFETGFIPWDEHLDWYSRAVADSRRHIFIAQCGSDDIGMFRLDGVAEDPGLALVSVALRPDFRGRSLAAKIVRIGAEEARKIGYRRLLARIRGANVPSLRAFQAAGFSRQDGSDEGGVVCMTLELASRP